VGSHQDGRTVECRAWPAFVRDLFAQRLAGGPTDAELWVVVEQGATLGGYNLSVVNPPWEDAQRCARDLRSVWRRLLAKRATRPGS
jgi:hypothetical protein